MSSPDLFVVCKSCGSEVSPYVTECPYCGTRLRKRAPKIEREGGVPKPPKPGRRERRGRRQEPHAGARAGPVGPSVPAAAVMRRRHARVLATAGLRSS